MMVAEHTALIGRRISEARQAKGLTQQGLGAEIPGKPGGDQVSKWERGIHRPGDDTLAAIAKATDRDVAWFHSEAPDKTETPDPFAEAAPDESVVIDRLATLEGEIGSIKSEVASMNGKLDDLLAAIGRDRNGAATLRDQIVKVFEQSLNERATRIGRQPPKRRPVPPSEDPARAA